MKRCRTFYLNSRNRTSGTNSSFYVKIEIPPHEKFTHVCLLGATIPKSYYLIQAGYNTFVLRENGVDTVVTIPAGNYNLSSFRTQIPLMLTASSPHGWAYTCTYPPAGVAQTGKLTFTVAGNAGLQPSFVFTNNVNEQFGFDENTTATFAANTLTSTNVVKFQLEDSLFIHTDLVRDGADDVLQSIFVASPDFSSITYQCPEYETGVKLLTTAVSQVFRFALTNEDGRLIDLNGQNWQMTIMVSEMNGHGEPVELDERKVGTKAA
jgi:hypothetical protein